MKESNVMSMDNGNDPWSRRPKNDQPPGLDELLQKWMNKMNKKGKGTPGSGSALPIFAIVAIVVLYLLSGIFIINPAERAVVLLFGKYYDTLGPGIHWAPRGIQQWQVVNIEQIKQYNYQSEMLTRDENYAVVDVAIMYRVSEPEKYLFNVTRPEISLREAVASSLRQVVGQTKLEAILTTGREKVRAEVEAQLNEIIDSYGMGIMISDVKLQDAKPPQQVMRAFDDAIKAREDKQTSINRGQAYANAKLPIARGQALRLQNNAEAARAQAILDAESNVAPFKALQKVYRENPSLTHKRLYLDAMERIFAKHPKILTSSKNNLMYLPIQEMLSGKATKLSDTSLRAQSSVKE